MSNYQIGDYNINSKSIYNELFETQKTSTRELKRMDRNKDGKISEDELQELSFVSGRNTSSSSRKVSRKVDKNGNVTQETITEGSGKNKITTKTTYDSDGKKIKKVVESGSGDSKVVKTTTFHKNGNRAKCQIVRGSGREQTVTITEYDKNGREISTETYKTKDGKIISSSSKDKSSKKRDTHDEISKVCDDVSKIASTIEDVIRVFDKDSRKYPRRRR